MQSFHQTPPGTKQLLCWTPANISLRQMTVLLYIDVKLILRLRWLSFCVPTVLYCMEAIFLVIEAIYLCDGVSQESDGPLKVHVVAHRLGLTREHWRVRSKACFKFLLCQQIHPDHLIKTAESHSYELFKPLWLVPYHHWLLFYIEKSSKYVKPYSAAK